MEHDAGKKRWSSGGMRWALTARATALAGARREALMSVTEGSGVYAVIAPNMGKQIVALQVWDRESASRYIGGCRGRQ